MGKKQKLTDLGMTIKKRLIELNMTQRELASMIGINEVYLNMIMYGNRSGRKYLNSIFYHLSIEWEENKIWVKEADTK